MIKKIQKNIIRVIASFFASIGVPGALAMLIRFAIWLFHIDVKIGGKIVDMSSWDSGDKAMFGIMSVLLTIIFVLGPWIFSDDEDLAERVK